MQPIPFSAVTPSLTDILFAELRYTRQLLAEIEPIIAGLSEIPSHTSSMITIIDAMPARTEAAIQAFRNGQADR